MRYELRRGSIVVGAGVFLALFALLALTAPLETEARKGIRAPHVHPHGHLHPNVARRINHGAYRPASWVGSRDYWGDVVGGVGLGTAIGVAAVGVIPRRPAPHLCWYWNNPARTSGYWITASLRSPPRRHVRLPPNAKSSCEWATPL